MIWLSNLNAKKFLSAGFGFSDKPQPKYGFDYTLDGKMIETYWLFCLPKYMHSQQHNDINSYFSEYTASLGSLINAVAPDKLSIVVQVLLIVTVFMYASLWYLLHKNVNLQGYFAPVAVKYASEHQDKLNHLVLVNPPVSSCYSHKYSSSFTSLIVVRWYWNIKIL